MFAYNDNEMLYSIRLLLIMRICRLLANLEIASKARLFCKDAAFSWNICDVVANYYYIVTTNVLAF